jgi:HSP20 family molecular chaperone IbpA
MNYNIDALPIMETDELYVQKIIAPGYTKDDITVTYNKEGFLIVEISDGFEMNIFVPISIDFTTIKCNLSDGILTINIPKAEEIELEIN